MHFVCTYTSGYFLIYGDEYARVHYDDDHHHASHDTQRYAVLRTSLQTANSTMMDLGGANRQESTLVRVSRV